ncbi:uncharacterized protein LOC130635743 [Hydractinia symbiolongicarpus]|uniref:uncharacterized protein LOC130635743 n=1 Tax=Hydractinia symbiolongicarpus TaxID=13093 RepID=UPI002550DA02|nr:uncharacterized protein LOC130635743 [Hydractinia symbiolongicarpus]
METNQPKETLFGVQLYEAGVLVIDDKSGTVTEAGKREFGGRLSASLLNDIYKMFIKKIRYNEVKSFTLLAVFNTASGVIAVNHTASITNVKGGPDVCGISLKSSYIVNEGKELSFLSEVCGNPKPILTWKMENELGYSYSTDIRYMETFTRRYRYIYRTHSSLTRKHCGTKIIFNANGANEMITGEAVISVTFWPRKIRKVIFYRDNDCVNGTWTSEATGNCALTYHIHFGEKSGIHNTTDTHYALCNIFNISNVVIWASYKYKHGQKTKVNISLTTPVPSTKAADTCKHPIPFEVKSLDTKKFLVTIIITLVITQIANICIYGFKKLRGTGGNSRNKQSTRKDDGTKDSQDYELFPTTTSHYTGLQLEAREEIVYADLSPTTVNEYSEIGTENMSKQTY